MDRLRVLRKQECHMQKNETHFIQKSKLKMNYRIENKIETKANKQASKKKPIDCMSSLILVPAIILWI